MRRLAQDAWDRLLRIPAGHDISYWAAVPHGVACKGNGLSCVIKIGKLFIQLIMLDELKNDYRNPVDFCQNLNRVSQTLPDTIII